MISIRIETRRGWLGDNKRAFVEAVQAALGKAFLVPIDSLYIALFELDDDCIIVPEKRSKHFIVVEIKIFTLPSPETKQQIYTALITELVPFVTTSHDLKIVMVTRA